MATLSPDEIERYARHIVLKDFGGSGQQKLKEARVRVVGAGGLGAPVLTYLAAAGIGTLGVVDADIVSLSNLQRQTIHDTDQVGVAKVDSARKSLGRINPHVSVVSHQERIAPENARQMVRDYDAVADGSDNFETRFCVADACEAERKPLVTAAVGQYDGSVTTLKPFETDAEGRQNPTYRCLVPAAPPPGLVPTCTEAGILGALTGVVGSLQALEVIKEITGIGEPLVGRLLLYDALAVRFETVRYRRALSSR
ncbi:MAG: molybdopterin-synthase adenylyltransferase MoeB [Pseudomonadota bacterium]